MIIYIGVSANCWSETVFWAPLSNRSWLKKISIESGAAFLIESSTPLTFWGGQFSKVCEGSHFSFLQKYEKLKNLWFFQFFFRETAKNLWFFNMLCFLVQHHYGKIHFRWEGQLFLCFCEGCDASKSIQHHSWKICFRWEGSTFCGVSDEKVDSS